MRPAQHDFRKLFSKAYLTKNPQILNVSNLIPQYLQFNSYGTFYNILPCIVFYKLLNFFKSRFTFKTTELFQSIYWSFYILFTAFKKLYKTMRNAHLYPSLQNCIYKLQKTVCIIGFAKNRFRYTCIKVTMPHSCEGTALAFRLVYGLVLVRSHSYRYCYSCTLVSKKKYYQFTINSILCYKERSRAIVSSVNFSRIAHDYFFHTRK